MDQSASGNSKPLILSRTRNILQQVIDASYTEQLPDRSHVRQSSPSNQTSAPPTYNQVSVPNSSIFNKTWNLYRTTPFYNFHKGDCPAYEAELLTYIAANAKKNLSSTALITQTRTGMTTFVNENRTFPSQIDSPGDSLGGTPDHLEDIKRIEFQFLSLDNTIPISDDQTEGEKSQGRSPDKMQDSLMITITIRSKGKSKDQSYYCIVLLDQLHNQHHLYNSGKAAATPLPTSTSSFSKLPLRLDNW
ncbi:hypothetical protein BGZ51_006753 [Haplosporangium sp. Z 767]|nr:hypothetical protein BGZ51_006753 [Haplosporangium sp. Z 767]